MVDGTSESTAVSANGEIGTAVRGALERLRTPATALQILKSFGPNPPGTLAEVRSALALLVEQRRAHAWGQRFTLHDPERVMVEALVEGPLTQAELARALNAAAPGLATTAELRRALRKLCRAGVVREHPKLGKAAQRYGLMPPSPEPFVRGASKALRNASKRLERAGLDTVDLLLCLARELGVADELRERLRREEARKAGADDARLRIKTDPGVPLAMRAERTRLRKQTLPDSPGALRGMMATDEGLLLSTLGSAAPGYSMTLAQLKAQSGLSDGRFARAVLALTTAGELAVAGSAGRSPTPQELEDQRELETARASLPQAGRTG